MRVLHVFGRMDRGGAESRIMDIYRNIDREKVQFDFIVHTQDKCDFDEEIGELGGEIYRIIRFNLLNFISYRNEWKKFLAEHNEYNTVHIHVANFAYAILPLLCRKGIPIRIVHARSASDSSLAKRILVKMIRDIINRYSTHRLAVSNEAGRFVFGRKEIESGNVFLVPNAINVKMFEYCPEIRDKVRKGMDLEDHFILGHVGRFSKEKNHDFLLRVLEYCKKMNFNAILLLVGDGKMRSKVEQAVNHKGMENDVVFMGVRKDVHELLQVMDVFLLPSFYEGLPGAVIEAQASGLPCIISDMVTKECMVDEGLCVFLPINQDSRDWAEMINKVDISRRSSHIDKFIEKGFDIEQSVKWYEDFYFKKGNEI